MLNMYVLNCPVDDLVMLNDAFFDLSIAKIEFNKNIQNIMHRIDGVEYSKGYKFYSKFDKDVQVGVEELSTGCKTAINIQSFHNKIFYVGECGENALDIILNMKNGNILVKEFFIPLSFENSIKVIKGNNSIIVQNDNELLDIFEKVGF